MAAVNVDSEELADVIRRLRRAQGQIGGVIRMIEDGQECSDVLTQLAAAARALDRAGFKIIASGLCQCVLDEQAGRGDAAAERARLWRSCSWRWPEGMFGVESLSIPLRVSIARRRRRWRRSS